MQFIVQGYPAFAYTGGRPYVAQEPAIVFVHGAAFDHSVWQWQSRYLANHGFTVLAIDLPGHGRSPGAVRESIGDMAEWIAALLESAGLTRAAVVGHSMGSLVALETALRHPTKVSKLALVGTSAPMLVGEPFLAAAADHDPAGLDMEATWGHARSVALSGSPVPGAFLYGASRALNGQSQPGVLATDLKACNAWQPDMAKVRALDLPTLVAVGKRDQVTPAKAGYALAQEIRGAKVVTLDAGHSMMSEAPTALLKALREFLGHSPPP